MTNIRKVTRVKLQIDNVNDFILIGLVSSEADYKLSLSLNKKFKISLKNISPFKINNTSGTEFQFSRFSDISQSPDRIFNLFSNRSGKHFLISKLRNIDYILYIHDPDNKPIIGEIVSALREIAGITAVFNIEPDTIKDKNLHYIMQ
jgi:hypothetical protein